MEHGHAISNSTKTDPGDFVAEEAKIKHAQPNYIGVFIILGVLTAIEIGITRIFINTGDSASVGRVPILLFLTIAKALLVILYYMHLKFDSRLYAFFFGVGILAFAVPFVLALVFLLSPPKLVSSRNTEGGNGGGPALATPNPNAGPPVTFNVEGGEFYYKPDSVTVNAGQVVRVTLTNAGSVNHTFVLASKPKSEDATPWTTNDGKVITQAAPAGNGKGGFTAPGPGEWIYYCNVPGHAQGGMVGTLIVQ